MLPPIGSRVSVVGAFEAHGDCVVTTELDATVDESALQVVGGRLGVLSGEGRETSAHQGGRHRGAATTEVRVIDTTLGVRLVDRRSRCPQGYHGDARSDHVGLRVAPEVLTTRPRGDCVVLRGRGSVRVRRTDRHDPRVAARGGDRAVAFVAGRTNDCYPRSPGGLDGTGERVGHVGQVGVDTERDVHHPDVVVVSVHDDPADRCDELGERCAPVGTRDLHRDDRRARSDTGVRYRIRRARGAIACDEPGHEGAVAVAVHAVVLSGEVGAAHEPTR